jgi:aminopeptidase N
VPVLHRHGTRPHRLTVAAFDADLREVGRRQVDLADAPVRLEDLAGRVVVVNADDDTFAAVRPDDTSRRAVEDGLSSFEAPLVRAVLWWQAIERVESGAAGLPHLGALLDQHLRTETEPVILEAVLGAAQRIARLYAEPDAAAALLAHVTGVADAALAGGDPALAPAAVRAYAETTSDAERLAGWLADPPAYVDQEVRWVVVRRLAELGRADHVAQEEERDRTVAGHLAALAARAAVATPEAKARAWSRLVSGELTNHELTAVARGMWGWDQATLVEPYLERYLSEGLDLARASGQAMGQLIGRAFPLLPLPVERRRALRDRLAATLEGDVPTVLARAWNDVLDDIDRALAAREASAAR